MLKTIFSILAFALVTAMAGVSAGTAAAESFLGKHGDWEAFSDVEAGKTVCYMGSEPTDKRGKYNVRGATYMMVTHRPAENSKNVVSVRAGYTHKAGSDVVVIIGKAEFKLFTKDGWAFAPDADADTALVAAMIRGASMNVVGFSARGTKTTDVYSLKGFTAAYRAIGKACKVK